MFDENVIQIILKYYWKDLKNKRKVLLDWIDIEWLSWDALSVNPNAMDLFENNQDKINWSWLSKNPSIFEDEPMPIV